MNIGGSIDITKEKLKGEYQAICCCIIWVHPSLPLAIMANTYLSYCRIETLREREAGASFHLVPELPTPLKWDFIKSLEQNGSY
jgi:hypothetical protein